MYQQIQALNTEKKALVKNNVMLNCSKRNFSEFRTALSNMIMQNQFNKMSVFECQIISENIHKLKQEEFKDFKYFLTNFRTFKFCTNPVYTLFIYQPRSHVNEDGHVYVKKSTGSAESRHREC
jgi:hypothetical protein